MKYNRITKMKYKEYPRVYEKVFTSEDRLKKFDINLLETDHPEGKDEYVKQFASFFKNFDKEMWLAVAKFYWLQRRFLYKGKKRSLKKSCVWHTQVFSTFVKNYIGHNYLLLSSTFFFGKTLSYFEDFYDKDMSEANPFENPEFYKFPWKNIGLGHLSIVYQMDERLELLEKADKENMTYPEFLDFLINYINCVNDEMGKTVFTLRMPSFNLLHFPYIIYHFRKGATTALGVGKFTRSAKPVRRKPYEYNNQKI